jgi:hypothetical protein
MRTYKSINNNGDTEMSKAWKISVRFDPRTGNVKPWEVINTVSENGKTVSVVRWGDFKTEAAAIKGAKAKVARCLASPIFMHDGKTIEFVGE